MNTLFIAFNGCQVSVTVPSLRMSMELATLFRPMLAATPERVIGHVEVISSHRGFQLSGLISGEMCTEPDAEIVNRVRHEISLHFIQAFPHFIWLHAGAAALAQRVVLFLGGQGVGKSTLTVQLSKHGWAYLSDDLTPYDPASGLVLPYPQMPRPRLDPGFLMSLGRLNELIRPTVALGPEVICRTALKPAALILPSYQPDTPTTLRPCPPANALIELGQSYIYLDDDLPPTLAPLCGLAAQTSAFYLTYASGVSGSEVLDQTLTDLFQSASETA